MSSSMATIMSVVMSRWLPGSRPSSFADTIVGAAPGERHDDLDRSRRIFRLREGAGRLRGRGEHAGGGGGDEATSVHDSSWGSVHSPVNSGVRFAKNALTAS